MANKVRGPSMKDRYDMLPSPYPSHRHMVLSAKSCANDSLTLVADANLF
jgi:hypothetical protein